MLTGDGKSVSSRLQDIDEEIQLVSAEVRRRGKLGARGGYCTIVDEKGQTVMVYLSGEISEGVQVYLCYLLSAGGALRMRKPNNLGHVSSFQSKRGDALPNEVLVPAGAIRVKDDWIFSFNGLLDELADEAAMIFVALRLRVISLARAREIANISSNDYYRSLEDDFLRRHPEAAQ